MLMLTGLIGIFCAIWRVVLRRETATEASATRLDGGGVTVEMTETAEPLRDAA